MVQYPFQDRKFFPGPEEPGKISYHKILWLIFLSILQMANVMYIQNLLFFGKMTSKATILIYFIVAVISACFSARIYRINEEQNFGTIIAVCSVLLPFSVLYPYWKDGINKDMFSIVTKFTFTPFFIFLQIPTYIRHVFLTQYAVQCKIAERKNDLKSQENFYKLMIRAEADAGLVSVLDCYLRAAPQQIVQLSMIFRNHINFANVSIPQQISIWMAFGMIPWSITSFQGSLRIQQQNNKISWATKIIYLFWHFSIMVSRIISISCAIAFCPIIVGTGIFIHWIVTTTWLWKSIKPMEFYNNNKIWHFLFCCVFGIIHIFTASINLVNKPTGLKHVIFYCACFVENVIMITLWCVYEESISVESKIIVGAIIKVAFVIGIVCMIIYYTICHPKRDYTFEEITFENILLETFE